ncbi:MAG TPA: pyrophosphate--fructose-6-phosphate 1-phosphotransferase, partial [Sphingomicrobium sp.]|nr:pyrophosphate--fructose-6-phosphate 1-phosphotransferase [Sphingomicrobium sp.]
MPVTKVAMLTAGGLAPCLSSAVGGLIEEYSRIAPEVEIIAYLNGYAGLLTGRSVEVTNEIRSVAKRLHAFGGSPIGNSRVKLTNVDDCIKRGLVQPGQNPLHVAAEQLSRDRVDALHTIGGDDTNGTAADLAAYLRSNGHQLTVVGLPKTIDNDIIPIRQSLGAWTAAEQSALFARNIIAEHSSNPRMLIVHEVMGRNCGWLTAQTALEYHQWVRKAEFAEWLENSADRWDVHGIFVPERPFEIAEEAKRLRTTMDELDCVNLFISEGAGVSEIVAAMEKAGEEVPRDPFGHVQLDKINPGQWFAKKFGSELGADKVLVQKSGYFARSAAANSADLELIHDCVIYAVAAALRGESGVVG